jgi:hypothetical protein
MMKRPKAFPETRTIGQIAILMLVHCSEDDIGDSMCHCLVEMRRRGQITEEERYLFSQVICGWQATNVQNLDTLSAVYNDMFYNPVTAQTDSYYKGERIKSAWNTYLNVPYAVKKQWLMNLACWC